MSVVQFLKYDGKDLPIRVGYRAMKKVKEDNPDEKIEYDKDGNIIGGSIEDQESLLFHSLGSGWYAVHKNLDMPYSKKDMEFILDECFFPFMKMVDEFTDSVEKERGVVVKKVIPNRATKRKEEKDSKSKKK